MIKIKNYFKKGDKFDLNISYIKEKKEYFDIHEFINLYLKKKKNNYISTT